MAQTNVNIVRFLVCIFRSRESREEKSQLRYKARSQYENETEKTRETFTFSLLETRQRTNT